MSISEKNRKKGLFRRERPHRLKYITLLPSLITLMNGICGFAAIVFASKALSSPDTSFSFYKINLPWLAMSGYMIFVAMIADMLDGRVARMSHSTSSFGGQLDSLSDTVSFGAAPAFLIFTLLNYRLTPVLESSTPVLAGYVTRFIWLAAVAYLACACIRLARFNVENVEDETAHMSFIGLPTPAAAGVLASLVVLYDDIAQTMGSTSTAFAVGEVIILVLLPFATMASAVLMISRIRYPHILNFYLKGKKPINHLFWSVAVIGLIWVLKLPMALVVSFCGFASVGFGKWAWHRIIAARHTSHEEPPEPENLKMDMPGAIDG